MDLEALKAEFAARGGKVTRVEQGERAIYAAMRNGTRAAADAVDLAHASEARWERQQEAFRAAIHSGWSQSDALDYSEHAA